MNYPDDVVLVIPRSGQSLAFGAEGSELINKFSSYCRAKMLGSSVHSGYDSGDPALPQGLVLERLRSTLVEAIDMGYANHVFGHTTKKLPPIVWMYHGWGGYSYSDMKRGTACWKKGVDQLQRVVDIAKLQGKRVIVPCFDWIGGENGNAFWLVSGGANPEQTYTDWMLEYSNDINEVYRAITGQTELIPIVWCQTSSHTFYYQLAQGSGNTTLDQPTTALVTTKLSNQYPDKFITAGAKYHLPYAQARSVHLNAKGYETWGRKRGQIFLRTIVNGLPWRPLQPIRAVAVTPTTVRVEYDPLFAPIVLDTSLVTDPGNFGFQYIATNPNDAVITNVAIEASGRSVLLTFSKAPTGTNRSIGYAYNNADPSTYGETLSNFSPPYPRSMGNLGPRGCLRDSDPTRSFGQSMYNYAVHSITPIQ